MGEPVNWKAQHAIASGCIRELQAKLAKLEHETRGITFQTPDEKDARIEKLEAALREIASYQGHDSALDINAKHMRDTAREALGSDLEAAHDKLQLEQGIRSGRGGWQMTYELACWLAAKLDIFDLKVRGGKTKKGRENNDLYYSSGWAHGYKQAQTDARRASRGPRLPKVDPPPRLDMETIPVNLPFERVPQHANDPGFGPVPPMKCDCNYDDCLICHPLPQAEMASKQLPTEDEQHDVPPLL